MIDTLNKHRYLGKINEGIEKGNSLFYLYGKGVNDYSLFDTHLGIKEIKKSLFIYFYNIQKVDAFAVVKNGKITFLDKNGMNITTNKALELVNKTSGFGSNISKVKDETKENTTDIKSNNKQAEEATNGQSNFENDLKYIEDNFNTRKIAIYFDEFEWQSGLYGSEKNLELLKRVRNWDKSKKSFTIVSIKEPELLKEFGFEIDEESPNMIYLGNPSQIEISRAYRRYIYINCKDIIINENDFDYIVSSIQGSKKSLRESIRVLKKILNKVSQGSNLTRELFANSITKTIDEKVTFDDVILDSNTKENILNKINTFHKDKESSAKGIILYGPPGTGKTYIAKAIAHEYNMNFMAPALADLKGEYIGQTSGKVKRVFEEARVNSPTVIFLDEIDTIFPKRGGIDSDSYLTDMVNQFLVEIDGAKTGKQEIFIIGATNRLEVIDTAIRSRLSNEFLISLPNTVNRELMFDKQFSNFKLSQQKWKSDFIKRTEGMSGRDIDNFAKNIKALGINEEHITQDIFYTALLILERSFINDFKSDLDDKIDICDNVKLKFGDVVGYNNVKNRLKEELNYILSTPETKEKMKSYNIKPKRGNILYGPPGNGKTTFAQALAGEHDFYYIKILSKDFSSNSSQEILKKLDLIFSNTLKLSKMTKKKGVVLFFDEVDTLISTNMDPIVRGTLLNYLEDSQGIKAEDSKVILIAATNYIEHLDEASIRDGRFDTKLEIGYPSEDEAIQMLKRFFEVDDTLDLSEVDNMFYGELYNTLKKKKEDEINNINRKISDKRFYKIFEGIPTVDLQNIKEDKKRKSFELTNYDEGRIRILKGDKPK